MLRHALLPALMLLSSPVAATEPGDTARASLQRLQGTDLRVATIGWRLLTGNAARCPRQMPGTGLVLHALEQYPPGPSRAAALALHPGLDGLAVLGVVPGSPAAIAGLQGGDGIAAINVQSVLTYAAGASHATALRDAAERELAALPPALPLILTIRRGGTLQEVTLAPIPACSARLEVVAGAMIRARSDQAIIQLGQDFADGLDDDGLATVLAHELAHVLLDHHAWLNAAAHTLTGRQRKAQARQFEDEADRLSLDLLAMAGWDPAIAPRFLRRFAPLLDRYRHGGVHRRARDRADILERTLAERPNHDG